MRSFIHELEDDPDIAEPIEDYLVRVDSFYEGFDERIREAQPAAMAELYALVRQASPISPSELEIMDRDLLDDLIGGADSTDR